MDQQTALNFSVCLVLFLAFSQGMAGPEGTDVGQTFDSSPKNEKRFFDRVGQKLTSDLNPRG